MKKLTLLLLTLLCLPLMTRMEAQDRINLTGNWQFSFERNGEFSTVALPGTTDTNQKGTPCTNKTETTHLTRLYSYKGKAWYSREVVIPKEWKKQEVILFLERTKPTDIYIDGTLVSSSNDISTPQIHRLSRLKPGRHQLMIMVDNVSRVPEQIYSSSHAYTEDTQTNWNGIIGEIYLQNGEMRKSTRPASVLPCFREFHIEGKHFYADGHETFLRGKHDACVWPLTGHVPMDTLSWKKYLNTCKEYGINHIRFHSWCPPEAAFSMADELGIYLQPELPFWGDFNAKDSVLMTFLHKEGENILQTYGHHPSFVMLSLGNELWGSIDEMAKFVSDFRKIAPDKLYTFGSNYYLGYQGVKPGMDYFTTCRVGSETWGKYNTHTRGSFSFADAYDGGILNHFRPNSSMTLDEGCALSSVPVISHETGQFQTYPDYAEIKKYSGVLYPYNLEVFRERLKEAGMGNQAEAFYRASGAWSGQLYKADIELDLRTRDMAGFQLLDIQDYPGQGSAYIGILDVFMDSKKIITPERWRGFCYDIVPLLVTDSFCVKEDQGFNGKIEIANYSGTSLKGKKLIFDLTRIEKSNGNSRGLSTLIKHGEYQIESDAEGLMDIGKLKIDLPQTDKAWQYLLALRVTGTEDANEYDLWSYPAKEQLNELKKGIVITRQLTDEVEKQLNHGASVLWMPDSASMPNTVGGLFQTDYWNYRMFKTICENNKKTPSPGTLGILTDPNHPIFNEFPTEEHTNWQWFPIIKNSRPLILNQLAKDYRPVIQVIDNIERNHKLGLVMEFRIGQGKLLICMSDLEKASAYPEGKQFYQSVLSYMHSGAFKPELSMTPELLKSVLNTQVTEGKIKELNNISPY